MKEATILKKTFYRSLLAMAILVSLCGSVSAEQAGKDWYIALRLGYSPYTLEADGMVGNRAFETKYDLSDIMDKTDTTILGGELEFGMGKWFTVLNTFYQKSESDKAEARGNEATLKEMGVNPMVGYRVYQQSLGGEQGVAIDVMAGLYYVEVSADVNIHSQLGNVSRSDDIRFLDPMIGGRVSYAFTRKFGVDVSGQIGGFGVGSELQYTAAANLKYSVTDWFALIGGYKYWYFKYEDDSALLSELTQKNHGPVFGVELRF